jgi:HEAT repeat protein
MNASGDMPFNLLWASGPAWPVVLLAGVSAVVMAAMALFTLARLAAAGLAERHLAAVEERYGMHVMQAAISSLHDDSPIFHAGWFSRLRLKSVILARLHRTGGGARAGVADLYRKLGFLDSDLKALGSMNWHRRVEACTAVSLAGDERSPALLSGLLGDGNEIVRIAAARALVRFAGRDEAAAMLRAMETASGWCARNIADSIASTGSRAFEAVRDTLAAEKAGGRRARLTELLGRISDPRCIPILLPLLSDPEQEARIRAARALGTVKDRRSAVALERALSDVSWEVRAQAAKSLSRVGDGADTGALGAVLSDSNWWVRYNAAQALLSLGVEGRAELIRAAESGPGDACDIARQVLELAPGECAGP